MNIVVSLKIGWGVKIINEFCQEMTKTEKEQREISENDEYWPGTVVVFEEKTKPDSNSNWKKKPPQFQNQPTKNQTIKS